MDCITCDYPLPAKAKYCPSCGSQSQSSANRRDRTPREPLPPRVSPEAQARYAELMQKKLVRAKALRRLGRIIFFTVAALGATAFALFKHDIFAVPVLIGGVLFLFTWLGKPDVRLTEAEYYGLPATRDAHGEHRCVHCGHRGVYRHSPYRSSHTDADCSKCKGALWRGPKDS